MLYMISLCRKFYPRRSVLCSILAISIIYLVTLLVLEKRGFWITDNANKFLQIQALANSHYTDFSIPWPGQVVDPDFMYNPLPYHFTRVEAGKLYSVFSPVFALISAFFFTYLGYWGLYFLPVFSSLVMLVGLAQLARLVNPRIAVGHITILTTGLCTPVFFYSLVLWEHTPAICLVIWSIYYLLKFLTDHSSKALLIGMVAAGLAVYFRDEFYLLCLVLMLCTVLYTSNGKSKIFVLSTLILFLTLLPLWFFQWLTIDHPFGYHLSTHLATVAGLIQHLQERPRVFYNLFIASNPIPVLSLILAMPFIVGFVLCPRFSRRIFQKAIPVYSVLALLSAGLSLGGYFFNSGPIDYMLKSSNALFVCAPFVALAFLRLEGTGASSEPFVPTRWIWLVALSFAALYVLTAPQVGSMGIHWGNRYFLILYPLFSLLAANNLFVWLGHHKSYYNLSSLVVAAVIVCSFAAQTYGISVLKEKKLFSYRLNRAIGQRPEEVVITNQRWVPHALCHEFYQRPFFYVSSPRHFDGLVQRLADEGYKSYVFVTAPRKGPKVPIVKVDDGKLNYFNLQFFSETLF